MNQIAEIKSAKKRSSSMGASIAYLPEYASHPLAAPISNYSLIIDAELCAQHICFLNVLWAIYRMAKKINEYCDNNRISGDVAAQYWLNEYLSRCDSVADFYYLDTKLVDVQRIDAYRHQPLTTKGGPTIKLRLLSSRMF